MKISFMVSSRNRYPELQIIFDIASLTKGLNVIHMIKRFDMIYHHSAVHQRHEYDDIVINCFIAPTANVRSYINVRLTELQEC